MKNLEDSKTNPRTVVLAKRLFYEHALTLKDESEINNRLSELKAIVENKNASGGERDIAFDALIENKEWQGFDDWYLSLFADETLLELRLSENSITAPLISVTNKNSEKWIPILTKLVGDKNKKIHDTAVNCLIEIADKNPSKEVLEPLLPWLTNAEWANDTGRDRSSLISKLSEIDLPESIPGLIWLVDNEDSDNAASTLAKYKDWRAIPSLRNALLRTNDERSRQSFIYALIACDGLTDIEMVQSIETYAQNILSPENYKKVEERDEWDDENPLPISVSIGKFLAKQKEPTEGFVAQLIKRQKVLQKEKPEVAKVLSGIMAKWQGRLIDLEIIDRIADGKADVETIVGALARRKELKERISNELYILRGKSGLASATAACLIEDDNDILSAFHSEDVETRIGTLACARLLRKSLPVREVGALLDSPNKLLALAAERYLESEDSPEARKMVLSKHPNEALILGARDSFNPAKKSIYVNYSINDSDAWNNSMQKLFSSVNGSYIYPENYYSFNKDFDKQEEKLRKEIIENDELKEIFASGGNIIRLYQNKAVFTWQDDAARYRERTLDKEEIESFRRYIIGNDVENLKPTVNCSSELCGMGEFIMLNRNGGRRIFSYGGLGSGLWMSAIFLDFQKKDAKFHYKFEKYVSGLEILLDDEKFQPQVVWKNGDDFRVLVSDEERKSQIEEEIRKLDKIDDDNEDLDYEIRGKKARQRRIDRAVEHYEWREFKDGKLGAKVDEPIEVPFLRDKLTFPVVDKLRNNDSIWQSRFGNYEIRAGENNEGGLWKTNRSERIEFKKGVYANPIVSGNWVVEAKAEEDWVAPNNVVRINLQTGKESKINLPPAEEFQPIAFVAALNKVLLYRGKEAYSTLNPTIAEYYLLDANTGKTELIKGEFQPLITQTFRPLQPTGKTNEFWATVYSRAKNETDFGVYNTQDFTFKPLMKLPEILLNSTEVWVDEKAAKIYFIYGGDFGRENHLLSLPLPLAK